MTERFKISLSGMWLFVSIFTLIIPVFLPSFAGSANPATHVVGAATASMFILTFPSSLFGIPLLFFVGRTLGVDPNSIEGMYLNIIMMFVLGLIQWFWIVPRVWRRDPDMQVLDLDLPGTFKDSPKTLFRPAHICFAYDEINQTPVERIFRQDGETG